ncbi:MAG: glutamate synthase large subunit [candidate division NC10 bacterium]|nr:glutamate synthase large subunit [candidate division NC10 bacterium]
MHLIDPQPSTDPAALAFPRTLYRPVAERDACGTGFVASIAGERRHGILRMGVEAVINLTHRGAVSADGKTGDGAGVLTQIPHDLFRRELLGMGVRLERDADLGVGMIFFPQAPERQRLCRTIIEGTLVRHGILQFGWRLVPIDPGALGAKALATVPRMEQVLMGRPPGTDDEGYERTLYLARKEIEEQVRGEGIKDFYIPSFSHRTVVYKGLFVAPQLPRFYRDLADPLYTTALIVFHQRYSTNTFPTWFLAQPFRMLGHNGEINTLQGNQNWMYAREKELHSRVWGTRVDRLRPLLAPGGSDSANLDNVLEALVLSGRDIRHAFMMLIPEAWENMPQMDPALKAFYEYHACLSEPWDGPAAIAFTDGVIVGATLDRNGLRPARYNVTGDGIVVMASEVGVVELDDAVIIEKGRLGPGKMIAVDTARGLLLHDEEIKGEIATRRPYREWVAKQIVRLTAARPGALAVPGERPALTRLQRAFGYTAEEISLVLTPMFSEKKEPVGSMGDDTPLAVLSRRPRLLYSYFKQRFAQVTNPPIDPLREQIVMSLSTYVGSRGSLLEEAPESARLIHLESPILFDHELKALRRMEDPLFASVTLSTCFTVSDGPAGLERALRRLTEEASRAVDEGKAVLILSDRGVDADHAPMPMLLAVGAVVHHLIKKGKGMRADVVAETGEAWEHHHFATLIGYGAAAVNPTLAFQAVAAVAAEQHDGDPAAVEKALGNYKAALDKGILKIMSKMGISALASYQGAQIFEAIGLSEAVVERCFVGTPSSVGGIGLREIAEECLTRHRDAFGVTEDGKLVHSGFYTYRKSGEQHAFNPPMVKALHAAVRGGDYAQYRKYAELVNEREPLALRDLLRFRPGKPIPLEEVEPAEEITRRFSTQAMSIGALGPEAHKTLAIAMNRLGAKSNTGEGGEDPAWFHPMDNGDTANSKIKQVASARFGVTPEYLVRAEQLEIKMAQGSKPGEGGQLPGHKVAPHIARIRRAVPGIPLISPAPHHDIYSIEDLSQLIYDLKMVNPRAKVGVKLVAEAGVGTIAAGVAKAYADVILISGHDGGTGASPLSSIKNAGAPWELGLSETQQVLVLNDLRGRVTLRVDGGMKTGRDVVIAAMLGAEEFGFGSAAVAAIGCVMTRQCHLNTCPVGIATQKPELRARFKGQPEQAIWFFLHVAQEVREILAPLGFRKLEEVVGRTELLEQILPTTHPKAHTVDLRAVLGDPDPEGMRPRRCIQPRNDRGDVPLDETLLQDAAPALERGEPVRLLYPIRNIHRTVGARLAGVIADKYGDAGMPDGTITLEFTGSAGQSFGAFLVKGMVLRLTGEANDYVGKGMGGGELSLCPPAGARFIAHENVIMGNTCLYGATGGFLFAAGRAGERFAVRNSGCTAVVEGVGDHGCEYMTAGCIVILGETGRNFGAGMTNGEAYVLDEAGDFPQRYNPELVTIERVTDPEDAGRLRHLVERHERATGSARAAELLARWGEALPRFWKVTPKPPEGLREPPPRVEEVAAEPATAGAR